MLPATTDKLALRAVALVAAGPAANILSGVAVLLLPLSKGFPAVYFIAISLLMGLSNLLPFQTRVGVSDGKRLWMLLRNPVQGARFLALMKLQSERVGGVLPESASADFLAKATAVRDNSEDTVAAFGFAFLAAFHQGDDVAGNRRFVSFCHM